MIEEQATVVAIEGQYALLQTQRKSTCQSCSVQKGCGTSVLSKVVGQRSSQVRVDNTLNVAIGDLVLLGIKENALVQGSLLVYALPLLFMLTFALIAEVSVNALGLQSELLVIMAAMLGFAVSVLVIRFGFYRTGLKHRIQPIMLRIIEQSSAKQEAMLAP